MDSHDALHCRQEGDVQVTEKVEFSNRAENPSVLVQLCLGAERRPFQYVQVWR